MDHPDHPDHLDHLDTALAGIRDDLPGPSPLALSRARVRLVNHATREQPARVRLFHRPAVRIAVIGVTAAAAVAGVGWYGSLGPSPSGSGEAVPAPSQGPARHTTAAPRAPVHVKEAAWSVDTLQGGDVRLTMRTRSHSQKAFDLEPLTFEKTLARAGVPATTRRGELCHPDDLALNRRVIHFDFMEQWTIHPSQMPVGSRIVISYQSMPMGAFGFGLAVETAGHPLRCAKDPDPKWTPEPGKRIPPGDKIADGPAKNT